MAISRFGGASNPRGSYTRRRSLANQHVQGWWTRTPPQRPARPPWWQTGASEYQRRKLIIIRELQDWLATLDLDETEENYEARLMRAMDRYAERTALSPNPRPFVPPKRRQDRKHVRAFLEVAMPILNMPSATIWLERKGFAVHIFVLEPEHAPAGRNPLLIVPWSSKWARVQRWCAVGEIEDEPPPRPRDPDEPCKPIAHPRVEVEFVCG
jgi:hypothetical protein